ncbi:vanadium-dependent haloperoxidase [Streptomyces sp. NPDC088747]|uniref:vanadium-dependent haloperoxidase n=1 Tax=Streptomyces sp. NPDC088747 TaxID=3365886 RepID=UPI0038265AB5
MTTSVGHPATPAAAKAGGPAAKPPAGIGFDFDNGNFIRDLVTTNAGGAFPPESGIGPNDATIYIWITHLFQISWFDAMAPYHPTAVGLYSRIARRPASEAATNRNKNIAGLYASYQVVRAVFEERALVMRQGMLAVGLDPDDDSQDPTTPIGIGNIAGKAIVEARLRDGLNFLGDEGRTYNGRPFEDYTGYQPVNSAYELADPSRWQPAVGPHRRRVGGGPGDMGVFVVQNFVTPQLERVTAHTFQDPAQFKLDTPGHTDHTDAAAYKSAVDEVLAASAALTDEQKVKAEFFDNKLMGHTLSPRAAAEAHDLDLDGWCHLFTVTSVARFDALIAAWHHKRKHEAPRPVSAVRHVYGNSPVTAWGGPGKGTVSDLPANEWASYLPAGDHPDYPSGSTILISSQAQASRRFLGDDVLNWKSTLPAGSTRTEPGLTPAADTELRWDTWTDFEQDCARSRVWGGVHFTATVDTSIEFGAQFGDLAHDFLQRHINGDVQD